MILETYQISKKNLTMLQTVLWTIWTYFASAEAFLPKISLFTKIEVDRDQ